eukprot:TRINITY_DN30072_c0_g1_i1.p1 TRINITY_DN30072_c0_g1~~TRINITY_DN30072_c0_g1_i1.p1  ORF type:complete len:515 (-),score=138.67 TRINITY_DN30072_c0_g1_i1:142-1686(-)
MASSNLALRDAGAADQLAVASPPTAGPTAASPNNQLATTGGKAKKSSRFSEQRPLTGGFRKEGTAEKTSVAGSSAGSETGTSMSDTAFSLVRQSQDDEGPPGPRDDCPMTDKLPFNLWVAFTVVMNTVTIGLEQDMVDEDSSMGDKMIWFIFAVFFQCSFAGELVVRAIVNRKSFFDDVTNILDICLVLAALVDVFFFMPSGNGGLIRLFTMVRNLRLVRLVRLVRMMPAFRELWLLVGGLVNSLKALGWVGFVVLIVLYVCSILTTTEIGQNDSVYGTGPSYDGEVWPYKEYFGTVWRSMFTLFQVLTLDSWCDDIVRHVVHRQPIMACFFIVFLLVTAFGLMNVVIGIIVENTLAAAAVADSRVEQQQAYKRKKAVEKLEHILAKSDVNRTGEISREELAAAGQSPIVQEQFQEIGLKFEEAQEIFSLLDYEKIGRIELKRFAASCRELVGGARRRDIVQVEITVGTLAQRLDGLDQKFSVMEQEVKGLHDMADDFVHNTVRLLTGFDGVTT